MFRILIFLLTAALTRGGEITVTVENVKSSEGKVAVLLFSHEKGFPNHPDEAAHRMRIDAREGDTTVRLKGIPPGRYAVCVIHDANDNGKLDRNFFGIPTEGVGISNGIRRERPKFEKAVVELKSGVTLSVPLKYW